MDSRRMFGLFCPVFFIVRVEDLERHVREVRLRRAEGVGVQLQQMDQTVRGVGGAGTSSRSSRDLGGFENEQHRRRS